MIPFTFTYILDPFPKIDREAWKEEILQKFRDSRNLPRKKKKEVRKSLQIEWNMANWDPYENLFTL